MLIRGPVRRKARKKPRYTLPAGPRGDAPQQRGQERADRYKKKPAYRKAVRDTRREAVRNRTSPRVSGPPTPPRAQLIRSAARDAGAARQMVRSGAASQREIRDARLKYLRERNRGSGFRLITGAVRASVRSNVEVAGRGKRGRGLPGATVEQADRAAPLGVIPSRATRGLGQAFAESPGKTSLATVKGLKDALVGIPSGLIGAATDPGGAAEKAVKDYIRRYGPLTKAGGAGVREFTERVKKEGAAGELLDASVLVGGGGAVAGRAVTKAARTGALGAKAERVVKVPRRRVRTSGGEAREQPTSPNFFRAVRQKRQDEKALAGQQRVLRRADARKRAAVDGGSRRGAADVVVREATKRGEVVPSRVSVGRHGVGRAPSMRRLARAQRVEYSKAKGRALLQIRREQRQEGVAGAGRGAGRAYAGLNRKERRAFKSAMQLGVKEATTSAEIRAALERRIAMVEKARRDGAEATGVDELPALRMMLEDPDGHFTPRLRKVVAGEVDRGKRLGENDPALGDTPEERRVSAESRRRAPQFDVLGVQRRGTPIRDAERSARRTGKRSRQAAKRAQGRLLTAERRVGAAEESARRLAAQGKTRDARALERASRAQQIHERAAANHKRRADRARSEKTREAHEKMAEAAQERAHAAHLRAQSIEARPGETRLRRRVTAARGRREDVRAEIALARREATDADKRARELRAARRGGQQLVNAEPMREFLDRGAAAAEARGLGEPGFFASAPRESVRRSLFTAGGKGAVKRDKRYRGVLHREGREDSSFTTYSQGLARSIKRRHNWELVSDTVDEHAFDWGRNRSIEELRKELERRGVDEGSVGFWNPGVFREARKAADEGDDLSEPASESFEGDATLARAVDLASDTDRFATSRDWVVVPKELLDEIEADTRPSGWLGRSLDIVKGKQARILLGTSPAWLQFQIASNLGLTALAGVGPLEIVRAHVWWRGLSDAEKAAVEPYVGVGHFHDSLDQVRLGATADNGLVNGYRAFKAHPFWHKPRRPLRGGAVSQLNPLDALFRVDNAQNNAFRRAILYNRVKRDAYGRMGENVSTMQRVQDRVMGHLGRPPAELDAKMRGILGERRALERHAEAVNDFLGDYLNYTAKERRSLGRNVMFYGFLRFSLRFTFYTMPVKHPVMSSVIAQIGRMQTDEVRRLLGGDELPWAMGRFFFERDGKLKSIDVTRANPFLNTITEANPTLGALGNVRNALRFLPPVYVSLFNQAFSKSSFRDRPFRVAGETQGRRSADYTEGQRARIFLGEMLRLNAIYRSAEKSRAQGAPMGDDSLLFDQRPTQYKRADILAGIRQTQDRAPGFGGGMLREMVPFIPRDDFSPETAGKIRKARGGTVTGGPLDAESRALLKEARAAAAEGGVSDRERELLLREARAAAAG